MIWPLLVSYMYTYLYVLYMNDISWYDLCMCYIYIHICMCYICMISRTLVQCLHATNSSGKNAYRTFLKYPQVSFQFGLRTQPTLNFNNNIEECLYSVRCYRSVRENAYGIVFRAVCVLPSLVAKSRPRRFATHAGLGQYIFRQIIRRHTQYIFRQIIRRHTQYIFRQIIRRHTQYIFRQIIRRHTQYIFRQIIRRHTQYIFRQIIRRHTQYIFRQIIRSI